MTLLIQLCSVSFQRPPFRFKSKEITGACISAAKIEVWLVDFSFIMRESAISLGGHGSICDAEELFDSRGDLREVGIGEVVVNDLTVLTDEEFAKVP